MEKLTDLELLTIKINLTREKTRLLKQAQAIDIFTDEAIKCLQEDLAEIDSILKKIS